MMRERIALKSIDELSLDPQRDFVARLPPGIETKSELMRALKTALDLPDYFGRNWDALKDVLQDLSWISKRRVVLVHSDLPLSGPDSQPSDLITYLRVLNEAVNDWKTRPGAHELEAAFPARDQQEAVGIMRSWG